jgi:hypothetical protein
MAKKPTLSQQLADMRADNDRLQRSLIETLRERDDARASLASADPESDYWRKSMAQQAFPQSNPSTVSWSDLDGWFSQRRKDDDDLLDSARRICKAHDITPSGKVEAMLDALDSALDDADKLKAKVCTLGDSYNVGVSDPDDICDTLEEWAAKGTADSVRDDAWSLLAALDYDVRQLRFMDLDLDDGQIVFALKAQRRS